MPTMSIMHLSQTLPRAWVKKVKIILINREPIIYTILDLLNKVFGSTWAG